MEEISKEKMRRILVGAAIFMGALFLADLPDIASDISADHGWTSGSVYWLRTFLISLSLFGFMIAVSLWVDTPGKRLGITALFVLMLTNAPDVWKGTSDVKPFHPFATAGHGYDEFDYRLRRQYPDKFNYTPISITWYAVGTEHDPRREGGVTFAEGIADLSKHFEQATADLTRKVLQAPIRQMVLDNLNNIENQLKER
jgi:hypothetical protein